MEQLLKSRSVLRRIFTKTYNEIEILFNDPSTDSEDLQSKIRILGEKYEGLKEIDHAIYDQMVQDDRSEDDLFTDITIADEYTAKYRKIELKFEKYLPLNNDNTSVTCQSVHKSQRRRFKLPVIEFKKFGGDIREWLAFWSQFQKIHTDINIPVEDKFQYLLQATVLGSRARQLVESFPPISQNYSKAVESLQARFGREELLVEVYVRELLGLVLRNTMSNEKSNLPQLYDQIETQLRALASLGVTTDKCAAMLLPLVESCLSEELLRIWQRSAKFSEELRDSSKCRLDLLMEFLKQEVESEQRIALATAGFGLLTNDSKDSKVSSKTETIENNTLSNHTNPHVFLQTLRVVLIGEHGEKTVRALIDTGSQRSYILKSTAEALKYISQKEEYLVHSLFGGTSSARQKHLCYKINMSSLKGDYSCSFEALDQPVICNYVPPISEGCWTPELRSLNIEITDIKESEPIELLIGIDVAAKMFSGKMHVLDCGLVAFHTYMGWTLIGKSSPNKECENNWSMAAISLYNRDLSISNLWKLETIGISDPEEKRTKQENDIVVREHFLKTIGKDKFGRYEVKLPWIEGHPQVPRNFQLAKSRLYNTVLKLNRVDMFEEYGKVFQEWLLEEIIEEVPPNEISKQAHYWNHISGILNPADLPSRGCTPRRLLKSKWWEGPKWLYSKPKKKIISAMDVCEEDESWYSRYLFLHELNEQGTPDLDIVEDQSLEPRLKYLMKLRIDLRRRFRSEYLGFLKHLRSKGNFQPLTLNEIVLVGDDNSKRINWPLGRVVQLMPGGDGIVRVAKVQTERGQLIRPVQRLYPLEYHSSIPLPRIPLIVDLSRTNENAAEDEEKII